MSAGACSDGWKGRWKEDRRDFGQSVLRSHARLHSSVKTFLSARQDVRHENRHTRIHADGSFWSFLKNYDFLLVLCIDIKTDR